MPTFYYDESNNHRKLWIDPDRRAYNIDRDKNRKVPVGRNFVLGGVVHYGASSSADVSALIASLRLQKDLEEVKFKHIANGDFASCLKSAKVQALLEWVLASDLYVHFFNVNLEYWAFLDIVDDCVMWCHANGLPMPVNSVHDIVLLKDALYRVIRMDREAFLDMACAFGYPNIEDRTAEFVQALASHVGTVMSSPKYSEQMQEVGLEDALARLLGLLNSCHEIDDMTLAHMDEDGVLLDAFDIFYDYTSTARAREELVMDMEAKVKEQFESRAGMPMPANLRFADSKDEPLVQVSDLTTGLIARYFQFVDDHDHHQLGEWMETLSGQQAINLSLLKDVFDKSHERDHTLLHRLVSAGELEKSDLILYPEHFHSQN